MAERSRSSAHQRLAEIASRQGSAFTRTQALDAGVTEAVLYRLVHIGAVVRLGRGVYRWAAATGYETRLHGALLILGPRAVVSHRSAARLWGLSDFRESTALDATVQGRASKQKNQAQVHTTSWLPASHVVRIGDFRVTSLSRTVHGLARYITADKLLAASVEACRTGRTSPSDLGDCLVALGRSRGTAALRIVLDRLEPGLLRARSHAEVRLHVIVRTGDFPPHVLNYRVRLASGRVVVFDVAWPDLRAALECDSRTFHTIQFDVTRDQARDRDSAAGGWLVERIPVAQLDDPALVLQRTAHLIARARARR